LAVLQRKGATAGIGEYHTTTIYTIVGPAKTDKSENHLPMNKTFMMLAAVTLCTMSCDQSQLRQERPVMIKSESDLDKEIRGIMEKKDNLEERTRQVPAIVATFAKRTSIRRARYLGALCFLKTKNTPLMPVDIAEIALAETGSHGLAATSISDKGALGVWQLMPDRARSHGFRPDEMKNDEKCAEAAVNELLTKVKIARGNLKRAKKLYCGVGRQANAYEVKRMRFRQEILQELNNTQPHWAENFARQMLMPS
jgi:hypothetical protein